MLDPQSPIPLYQQLKTALRLEIEGGVWAEQAAIPPERQLIERFGVSRITVRQALSDLVSEGLLERRHGKGTFVKTRQAPIASSLSTLTGHLEELQQRGLDPDVKVISLQMRAMPKEVCQALSRSPGATGWYLHRLVSVDRIPLMLTELWLPCDLDVPMDEVTLKRSGLNRLLEMRGHVLIRGHQKIGAKRAAPETAKLLRIDTGDAVLQSVRVVYGAGDRPLIWLRSLFRSDRYEYEVDLMRRR